MNIKTKLLPLKYAKQKAHIISYTLLHMYCRLLDTLRTYPEKRSRLHLHSKTEERKTELGDLVFISLNVIQAALYERSCVGRRHQRNENSPKSQGVVSPTHNTSLPRLFISKPSAWQVQSLSANRMCGLRVCVFMCVQYVCMSM